MLYIDKNATIAALQNENARLDEQMASCEEQRSRMESTSLEAVGLNGEGFKALGERIRMRGQVLSAHYVAFEALRSANESNIASISGGVPDCDTPGIYDEGVVEQRIATAQASIGRLNAECQDSLSVLRYKAFRDDCFSSECVATMGATETFYESLINVQLAIIEDYNQRRQRAEEYRSNSSAIYSSAQACASSILNQSTSAVADCIVTGAYTNTAWTKGLEQSHLEARQRWIDSRVKEASKYLSEAEQASYRDALANGFIGSEEIYRVSSGESDSYFNEQLYSALVKLPDNLLNNQEIGSIVTAYNWMWEAGDLAQIERFFELSYVSTGQRCEYKMIDPDSEEPPQRTYVFSRSALLDRVNDNLQHTFSLEDKSGYYYSHLAALNIMGVVLDGNKTIESLDGEGVDIGITEFMDTADSHCVNAAMYLLEFNPTQGGSISKGGEYRDSVRNKSMNDIYESNYCFSGDLSDIQALMATMTNGKNEIRVRGSLIEDWGPTGVGVILSAVGAAPVSVPAGIGLAAVSAVVSVLGNSFGTSKAELSALKGKEATQYAFNSGDAKKEILNSLGFTLNMKDVSNIDTFLHRDESFSDYSLEVKASDTAQNHIDLLTDAYCHESGIDGYSSDKLFNDLNEDLDGTIAPASGNAGDENPANDSQAFLAWCNKEADLVYNDASAEHNYTPGKIVAGAGNLTNYQFISSRDTSDGSIANYQYRWEWNEQHPEDPR